MALRRKIELLPRVLLKWITHNRYYICEECHRIHKRNGKELDLSSKWAITVSVECASNVARKARKLIWQAVKRRMSQN